MSCSRPQLTAGPCQRRRGSVEVALGQALEACRELREGKDKAEGELQRALAECQVLAQEKGEGEAALQAGSEGLPLEGGGEGTGCG